MLILDKRCISRRHHVACWTVGQPTFKREWERGRVDQAKPKYKCAARDLIYALQDMTKHSAAARHNINSAFIPALSTLRFVLLRVVSLCNSVCVWSTFLAQVISADFMLKSEKPSSASGSERRLGGTHMFSFCGVLVDRASSSLLLLLLRCTPEWAKRAWCRGRQRIAHGSARVENPILA